MILSREIRSVLLFCSWCVARSTTGNKAKRRQREKQERERGKKNPSSSSSLAEIVCTLLPQRRCAPRPRVVSVCEIEHAHQRQQPQMRLAGPGLVPRHDGRPGRSRSPVDRPWPEAKVQAQGDEARRERDEATRGWSKRRSGRPRFRPRALTRFVSFHSIPWLPRRGTTGGIIIIAIGGPAACLLSFSNPTGNRLDAPCVRGVTADADAAVLHHVSALAADRDSLGGRPPLIRGAGCGATRGPRRRSLGDERMMAIKAPSE